MTDREKGRPLHRPMHLFHWLFSFCSFLASEPLIFPLFYFPDLHSSLPQFLSQYVISIFLSSSTLFCSLFLHPHLHILHYLSYSTSSSHLHYPLTPFPPSFLPLSTFIFIFPLSGPGVHELCFLISKIDRCKYARHFQDTFKSLPYK